MSVFSPKQVCDQHFQNAGCSNTSIHYSLKCDSLASGLLCFNLPIISFKVVKAKQCQGGRTAKECYQDSYINDILKNVGCVLTNTICRQLLQAVDSAYLGHVV